MKIIINTQGLNQEDTIEVINQGWLASQEAYGGAGFTFRTLGNLVSNPAITLGEYTFGEEIVHVTILNQGPSPTQ